MTRSPNELFWTAKKPSSSFTSPPTPPPLSPVLESLLLAVVSGGQVQIRWAGLAWRWPNAKPNLTSGTKLLVNIARNAKLSLPIMILPENAKPQESAHQESAHVYAVFVAKMAFARFDGQV